MDSYSIAKPDETVIRADVMPLAERAGQIVVVDKDSHGIAQGYLADLTRMERKVKELFSDSKAFAHKAHREICAAEKKLLSPISEARRKVNGVIVQYEAEQRRKAEEQRRRLEAEARKQEEEHQLRAAIELEEAGEKELAEQVLSADPEPVIAIEPEPEVADVAGVHSRTTWKAEVTDLRALLRHVVDRPELTELVQVNATHLNALARSLRENLKLPGVRVFSETTKVVRND